MWGRGLRGNNAACLAFGRLSVTFPTSHKQIVRIPRWVGLCMFLDPVGLSNKLLWCWEFLLLPQPPQVLQPEVLRLYFPTLEPWGVWSHSSVVPLVSAGEYGIACFASHCLAHRVLQPLPWCMSSPPLLSVWMNVSYLTPWLSDFHTVRFSVRSGCFFVFKFVVVLVLVVWGSKVYLPTPPPWPEVSIWPFLMSWSWQHVFAWIQYKSAPVVVSCTKNFTRMSCLKVMPGLWMPLESLKELKCTFEANNSPLEKQPGTLLSHTVHGSLSR